MFLWHLTQHTIQLNKHFFTSPAQLGVENMHTLNAAR